LLLVCDEGREEESVTRLARVGFDNVLGYLKGGISAWRQDGQEVDQLKSLSAEEFKASIDQGHQPVVDVRKFSEYQAEHVVDALNIPLDDINDRMSEFPAEEDFYLHCAGGYRSVITSSILKSRGYHNLINVAGGMDEIRKTGMEFTDYVCPSTLK